MLVLQNGRLLQKGRKYIRYRHLFLHLLAICVEKWMKERREGGGREFKEPRRREGRGRVTTAA